MNIEDKRKELQEAFPDYEGLKTMSENVLEYIYAKITEPGMTLFGLEFDLNKTIKESNAKKSSPNRS